MDKIAELKNKIHIATERANELKNEEQAIKLTMNSIYGAIGNNWFVCFNPDVAEAVTLQGQDLIKHSEKILDKYFHGFWHKDKELHDKLGIKNVRPITKPMVVYGDTDSNYVSFEEVVNSFDGWEGSTKDFILALNEHRIAPYLQKCFDIYAAKWGTDNYQDFELETLSENGIFLGKKKYVTNLVYDSGSHYESLSTLKYTGVEMVKGGTPNFVREKLGQLTKFIFAAGKKFELRDFVQELKAIKKDFKIQEPENISNAVNINKYEKYVLNDTTELEVSKGCPIHVRACAYHNFILNKSKYKDKYPLLGSGEKVRMYFVKTTNPLENNVFAYAQGTFPYEYAPPIDYDHQFTKTILDPINRFIEVMGYNKISPNLFMINTLF